jgi:hypothetical protein
MFLLQMAIQVILSSVQQSAFATWKEAVVVVFSLVSVEIFLSSKNFLAYSAGKGIVVFAINHPNQYYTITKEKGYKMPRFNTESNEYRVTFNELNVQSVPDIWVTWTKSSSCIPLVTSVKTESNRFCRVFNMSGTLWTFNS